MLKNASGRLCDGGIFVVTIPDSARIVGRCRWENSQPPRIGNSVYAVEFHSPDWKIVQQNLERWLEPGCRSAQGEVFGLKYRFSLTDSVEKCDEPLVHVGTFLELAQQVGLVLHMQPTPLVDVVAE